MDDIVVHIRKLAMIERRTLSVSLTPELHDFISAMVQEGTYGNSSEVVRAGLRLLRRDEGERSAVSRPASTPKEPQRIKG